MPVTASIGIAVAPVHGTSPDELLANADLAMYAAKAAGRNRFRVYSQTIHKRANLETRRQMQADLQEAIEAHRWKLYTRPAALPDEHRPHSAPASTAVYASGWISPA